MIDAVRFYDLFFMAMCALGGGVGYARAKSKASLIAGGVSAVVLGVASLMLDPVWYFRREHGYGPVPGLVLTLVVSVALAGRFVPAFAKTKKPMPAGLMSVLAAIGVVLSIAALAKG